LKQHQPNIKVAMGGGFPNTELRSLSDARVFEFFDFITLDDGEAPVEMLWEHIHGRKEKHELKRTFTLDSIQKLDENGRSIYGYFDSALTGDRLKIKDGETNRLKLDVDLKDLQSRNFFFLFYIPKGSKHGYLIIQKKSNHGVKNILENTFNQFLQMKGFNDYRFCLDFAQNLNQLSEMLDFGELKEINLTENKIKTDFQSQLNELEGIEIEEKYYNLVKSKI
jgi:hypothetical protein